MKRFGVQLAGSGIVILLGALGVAQAQRDSRTAESTQWDDQSVPALTPPPAPIAAWEAQADEAEQGEMASGGPATLGFGSFGSPVSNPDAVRTVAHAESTDDSAMSPASIGLPLASSPTEPAAASAALSLPGWSMPDSSQQNTPAAEVSPPTMSNSDSAIGSGFLIPENSGVGNPQPLSKPVPAQENYAAMPTLQFDAAPSNGLREAALAGQPTQEIDAPTAYESSAAIIPLAVPMQTVVPIAADMQSAPTTQLHPIEEADPRYQAVPMNREPEARIASLPQARLRGIAPMPTAINSRIEDAVLAEPGDRRLEGTQSPSIVIQKRAPEEVQVGKPATFVINVQNAGGVEALDVRIHDRVPDGMRLIDASPAPIMRGELLTWELGALEPGGERTVSIQLLPEQEGELGSVARVTFEAAASVRTISTRPALKITQRAPKQVLIGQQLEIELEVSNPGSGAATGVILQEDVPEGLEHPKGRQLDNVIGTLAPGEVRRQVLRLRAVAPGPVENRIRLTGDDGLVAEDAVMVDVIAPQLAIELEGPSRRFLERQAVFNVNLANIGTADATNVEVVAYLDRGFSFVATEYQGQYDPGRHAVYWSLAELPADGRGSVPLKLLPIEQGERAIRLEAKGDLNILAQHEKVVSVDTLAELTFSITDDADPIEVGSEVTYEIRISNRGSRDDSGVKLQMMLPPGLELVASEAEATTNDKGLISFAPTMSLPAGQDTVHRIRVRGAGPGTHIVKAIVTSAQATIPVTKEESTMVYADQ